LPDDYGRAFQRTPPPGPASTIFFSRESEEKGPLTWPEGNGWITRRLLERVGATFEPARWSTASLKLAAAQASLAGDTEFEAEFVISAAPTFLVPI